LALYGLRQYEVGPVHLTWVAAVLALSLALGPTKAGAPAACSAALLVATTFNGTRTVGEHLDSTVLVAVLLVSWAAAAVLLGGSVRGRRAERAALEERVRRQVAEERVRIARDLHDSVAHGLASISVQAGVGAHVFDERPEDARAALVAVKQASGAALDELRATLSMLRSLPGGAEAAYPGPGASLDLLPTLVSSSRAAGLPVEVVVSGPARPLPPAIDATAFRIVQESLTNVIRHAGPARATVAVRHGDDAVEVEVTDDGRGTAAAAAVAAGVGHGLAGMRERVALLGGEMQAGDRPAHGGYQVRARLPLRSPR
jgi:signal transduction histidine kinase